MNLQLVSEILCEAAKAFELKAPRFSGATRTWGKLNVWLSFDLAKDYKGEGVWETIQPEVMELRMEAHTEGEVWGMEVQFSGTPEECEDRAKTLLYFLWENQNNV